MYKITVNITKDKSDIKLSFDDVEATETWVPCDVGYHTVLDSIESQVSERLDEKEEDGYPVDKLIEALGEISSAAVDAMDAMAQMDEA